MPTGIQLSSGVLVGQPVPIDAKFGPYNSTADALNGIGVGLRYRGLTVGVYESGVLKEYWFKDGTTNEDFVAKSSDVTWDSLQDKPTVFSPDTHDHAISDVTGLQTALDGKQASGNYATLESGKVPASQLPSYVDDVLEFANQAAFPATGESGKIYVALDTNKIYRWSGSAYVEVSPSVGAPIASSGTPTTVGGTTAAVGTSDQYARADHKHGFVMADVNASQLRAHLNVQDGAEVNVNADWTATSGDAQILNKPSTFPPSSHTHDSLQSGSGNTLDTFNLKSGGVNGFFFAKTFNTNDPCVGLESYDPNTNQRVGLAILGSRGANGFLQGINDFRIEKSGGVLGGLQVGSLLNSAGQQLNLPSTAGTLALNNVEMVIACSDETSNLTVGANKVTFRSPYRFLLNSVRASVNTAPTGSPLVVDINHDGVSLLSTKLSIDAGEKTSVTAAAPAVLTSNAAALPLPHNNPDFPNTGTNVEAEITIDIDQVGSSISGKGLKVVLIGTRA